MLRVFSEDSPLEVRYSSMVVRRKVPLMRKSKGIGVGVSSIDSELRICDSPYRRTSIATHQYIVRQVADLDPTCRH